MCFYFLQPFLSTDYRECQAVIKSLWILSPGGALQDNSSYSHINADNGLCKVYILIICGESVPLLTWSQGGQVNVDTTRIIAINNMF